MTAADLRRCADGQRAAADAAFASAVDLAASGDVDGLLRALDDLRLRSFACGVLLSDLARLSSH